MKTIRVVAAVIFRIVNNTSFADNTSEGISVRQVFATQRGYGDFKGGWEFPGGKIEEGETPEQALVREIREELNTEISVGNKIGTIEYDYPTFHLSMDCFECSIVSGKLSLLEHENAVWLSKENLKTVNWLPADIIILDKIEDLL
jgi:8-oxo-dGTP diphosphatase